MMCNIINIILLSVGTVIATGFFVYLVLVLMGEIPYPFKDYIEFKRRKKEKKRIEKLREDLGIYSNSDGKILTEYHLNLLEKRINKLEKNREVE